MVNNCKKSPRNCVRNPFTGRMIKRNGQTAQEVFKYHKSSLNEEGILYKHGKGQYQKVPKNLFCGPSGRAPNGTFPVNTQSRCRAALSYAHNAPYPKGIEKCAVRIARKHGWKCGTASNKLKKRHIKPSRGKKTLRKVSRRKVSRRKVSIRKVSIRKVSRRKTSRRKR